MAYTSEALIEAIKTSRSLREAIRKIAPSDSSAQYRRARRIITECNIDISHFVSLGGRDQKGQPPKSLEEILIDGIEYPSSALKSRLVRANMIEYKCTKCGILNWCGEPITLQLDHINGNHRDNRLENLRLLCPNCHSQTNTFCGKNIKKLPSKFSPEDIEKIKHLYAQNYSFRKLGKMFGVAAATIRNICIGKLPTKHLGAYRGFEPRAGTV